MQQKEIKYDVELHYILDKIEITIVFEVCHEVFTSHPIANRLLCITHFKIDLRVKRCFIQEIKH